MLQNNRDGINSGTDLLKIVAEISDSFVKSKSKNDVFTELTHKCVQLLDLMECAVYDWDTATDFLHRKANFNRVNLDSPTEHVIKNREGLVGLSLNSKATIVVDDTQVNSYYVALSAGFKSEICVPIQFHNKVYGIIRSEHPEVGFYVSPYPSIFELLALMAAQSIFRIEELLKEKVSNEQHEAEIIENQTKLDTVLETVSDQFAQLKHSKIKHDILLREVHHRVNNNLQIISSIIRLHRMKENMEDSHALRDISSRVDAMAIIHTNMYKTLEMNKVDLESYLEDLVQLLRGLSTVSVEFDFRTKIKSLNINTLVPLGMLIVELSMNAFRHAFDESIEAPKLTLRITQDMNTNRYVLDVSDNGIGMNSLYPILEEVNVGATLIQAYIEQLNGKMEVVNNNGLSFTIIFDDI
jgi:two-component sensor histidine kinase